MNQTTSTLLMTALLACSIASAEGHGSGRDSADPTPCETGVYRQSAGTFVTITKANKGFGYTFGDGITGNTQDINPAIACEKGAALIRGKERWPRVAIEETNTNFESNGVLLAGRLIAPPDAGKQTPLVIYAHGSEGTGWLDRARDPYEMVARDIAVFVYDKRGTGLSKGDYTQNFPQLANDLVAASREAKRLSRGRYGRFGLFGVSQGGWVAPLAAARANADFIAIAYGLVDDIAGQDASQVTRELRAKGYGEDIVDKGRMATEITSTIARSHYKEGLDRLTAFQIQFGKEPWFADIKGTFTGAVLRISADALRTNGMPTFDKLDIDWSLQPLQELRSVNVPQLWALAAEDRQAPIAITVERLSMLRKEGRDISLFVFPQADHGMREYVEMADGTRQSTRIAPGYYDLMADWAKGRTALRYGNAVRH